MPFRGTPSVDRSHRTIDAVTNARWRRWYLTAAIGMTSAVGIGSMLAWAPSMVRALSSGEIDGVTGGTDFAMFYAAADLAANDGWTAVYSLEGLADVMDATFGGVSFAYPPPFAMALEPLVELSYVRALSLWLAVAIGSIALFLVRGRGPALVAVLAMLFPLYVALRFGQFVPLAILILALTGWALDRDRPLTAGLILGLLVLKPQFLLGPALLLVLSKHRRSRLMTGVAASSLGLLAATAIVEPDGWRAFIEGFADVASPSVSTRWDFSISSFVGWLPVPLAIGVAIFFGCLLVYTATRQVGRVDDVTRVVAWGLILSLLLSPRVVVYDWSLLVVPFAWLGRNVSPDAPIAVLGATVAIASLSGYVSAGWVAWIILALFLVSTDRSRTLRGFAVTPAETA